MRTSDASNVVTLAILKTDLHAVVGRLAREHVAFDPRHRRAVIVDREDGDLLHGRAAAVILRSDGTMVEIIDRSRAISEAWIEDAFVRAQRPS